MKKGLIQVLIANLLNLALGIISGFILPKFISVDEYGYIKTYQLYITYAGFFHLGYIDGIYLLYGGKKIETINQNQFAKHKHFFVIMQLVITMIMIGVSVILKDWIWTLFTFSILPFNYAMFYKMFYQATGEFKKYSLIINVTSLLNAIGIVLLLLCRVEQSKPYVFMYLVCYAIIAIALLVKNEHVKQSVSIRKEEFGQYIELIKSGFVLMLGNFSGLLLGSIDRWCVKFYLKEISHFSYYSFAVSLQAMVDAFVSPFTIVLYNFLCNDMNQKKVVQIRRLCLICGSFLIIIAFPCRWIVETFISQYVHSLEVMFILFSTEILYLVIKGLYVNLYKVEKKQSIYFRNMVRIIVIGLVLNVVFFSVMHTKESFAYGTLVSTIIWLFMSCHDFPEYKLTKIEMTILLINIVVFLAVGKFLNVYVGFLIYSLYIILVSVIFFKDEMAYLWNYGMDFVTSKLAIFKRNK